MHKLLTFLDVKVIVGIIIFSLAFWGITYTSDWEGYVYGFENQNFSRDVAFEWMSELCQKKGWDFVILYRFHILLMAILYSVLYKVLKLNPIPFVLLTLLVGYVGLGNQIRYYVAFPITIIACYLLNKKLQASSVISSVMLQVASMCFHSTTIILYTLYLFARFFLIKFSPPIRSVMIVIANIIIYYVIYQTNWFVEEQYDAYKSIELTSSLLGGIFNLTPAFLALYYVWRIKKNNSEAIFECQECSFIYIISLSVLPLILVSFYMQILGSRILVALLPLYLGLFVRVSKITKRLKYKTMCHNSFYFTLLYFIIWRFILPMVLNVNMQTLNELVLMLKSYIL